MELLDRISLIIKQFILIIILGNNDQPSKCHNRNVPLNVFD